jgi:MFS transporter, ACS family, glucarate transporter
MSKMPTLVQQERSSRARYRVMAFLCSLSFMTYYDRQCIVRAQEDIQSSLSIDDQQMGLVLGAFWLAYAIFEIPGGWLSDRYGARFTLTRIVLAWSVFTSLTGFAFGFYSLLAIRFLFGVGEAGAYPNMGRIQAHWLPLAERARGGGLLWLTARWGAAFAPILFGSLTRLLDASVLGDHFANIPLLSAIIPSAGWRLAFLASGLIGLVWCVAFYRWFRDDPAEVGAVNGAELQLIRDGNQPKCAADQLAGKTMWRLLLRSPSLWAIAVYFICGGFGWSFFVSWMPRFLKEQHGMTFEQSEWSTGLPLFCGGIACLVGGILSDALVKRTNWTKWGRALFPMVGCATAAAAMLAVPHVQTTSQATILMCLAATAYDFGQAATWATLVGIGGRYAGTTIGFINMVGNLGVSAQPYFGAKVFNGYGWQPLFAIYAAAFLMAMSTWLIIAPQRTFYSPTTDRQT